MYEVLDVSVDVLDAVEVLGVDQEVPDVTGGRSVVMIVIELLHALLHKSVEQHWSHTCGSCDRLFTFRRPITETVPVSVHAWYMYKEE